MGHAICKTSSNVLVFIAKSNSIMTADIIINSTTEQDSEETVQEKEGGEGSLAKTNLILKSLPLIYL